MSDNTIILIIAIIFALIFIASIINIIITKNIDFVGCPILIGAFMLFWMFLAFCLPSTTLEEDTMIIRTPIVAFEDNTNTKIYGRISGGLFYTQGEIQSEQQYTLTVLSLDSNNKATFKHFDVEEINIYFVDSDEAYYEYRYDIETKVVILFGKQVGKPEMNKRLKEINVYLPLGSIKYDNQING